MMLLFSMMDGSREVRCAVSASAMDKLDYVRRTPANQREEQFERLRDRIEACASRKFLAREFEGTPPGVIVRGIDLKPESSFKPPPRSPLNRSAMTVRRRLGA
jgi:hypothetical protein